MLLMCGGDHFVGGNERALFSNLIQRANLRQNLLKMDIICGMDMPFSESIAPMYQRQH